MWPSGTHSTAYTTTWFWVASAEPGLSRTWANSGSGQTFPSSPQRPRAVSTACLRSSRGTSPSHLSRIRPCQSWILMETWRLIEIRIAALQRKDGAQKSSRTLSREIKASLQEDWRQRAAKAGSSVDVGKTLAGYKRGRPLPVLPRIRPRLPRGTQRVTHDGLPRQTLTSTTAIRFSR